jgi:glyoxylase-like metal-dependent hydrolase (beta-lactamase superfamily II)
MKIAQGVEVLELKANVMGQESTIYPTLIWDDQNVVLADAGFPGMLKQMAEAFRQAGVPCERLNKVILTHQDIDHVGGLPALLAQAGQKIEVLAHAVEKPYIEGTKPLLKWTAAKHSKMLASLPEEKRQQLVKAFANPPTAKIDVTVRDGEILPYCGGITVIATPGHTYGHICLYHQPSQTLIAGDALNAAAGKLQGPTPSAAVDLAEAYRSLQKLAGLNIKTVVCYHGGICQTKIKESLRDLVE